MWVIFALKIIAFSFSLFRHLKKHFVYFNLFLGKCKMLREMFYNIDVWCRSVSLFEMLNSFLFRKWEKYLINRDQVDRHRFESITFLKNIPKTASFVYFRSFTLTNIAQIWRKTIKAKTVCLGLEPRVTGW